ncbi:anaerobic ribonucleoside-triphosphate reductase activating protein [Vagococcus xieshaowenii]|uniref:Anaerobic ribonucleoside-triphosphate reductase-activating protein n=1 Tax=Vagococcus xieshaowenii TaxID=2562451 RepID=A0AAJ5JL11_9ENTE|nr:anaerobic ribonucleoside-triphosphate reductase activating protein [Vagococcus xieshaowenii]QCA29115.1 anaerobic ribonucleoside-triphosphate reductase activating protein [Vagococcus xieshaowenii]TFZ40909.1 anaerobic ribonucleoside-triphosphate reductase activating protein [Vagococcus xieshaowenii]
MRNPKPKEWLAEDYSQHYYADYKPFNFVDGEGVRCSLYVSGCLFACEGCYNKAVQSFRYGQPYSEAVETRILADLSQPYCQGLTLLGGEPFLNTGICLPLAKKVREQFGHSKDIWAWSGYTFEELLQESADKLALLSEIDILVDGRFEISKKDLKLQFRGSSNQRIIDVVKSLEQQQVVIWDKCLDANETFEQIKREK